MSPILIKKKIRDFEQMENTRMGWECNGGGATALTALHLMEDFSASWYKWRVKWKEQNKSCTGKISSHASITNINTSLFPSSSPQVETSFVSE